VLVEADDELLEICKQYGTIYQRVLDLSRDQLLIEVEELSALRLLKKFKHEPPQIGGFSVRVSSATHQELIRAKAEQIASQRTPVAKSKVHGFNPSYLHSKDNSLTSAVLFAHVEKETVEVKHDVLRQAFSKYGRIVCLVSFRHKNTLHCLVQYPDVINAGETLRKLNDINIYDDCCILRVSYGNITKLVFKDDGKGCMKLVHHSPQLELSKRTVNQLQIWRASAGMHLLMIIKWC